MVTLSAQCKVGSSQLNKNLGKGGHNVHNLKLTLGLTLLLHKPWHGQGHGVTSHEQNCCCHTRVERNIPNQVPPMISVSRHQNKMFGLRQSVVGPFLAVCLVSPSVFLLIIFHYQECTEL